MQIWRPPSCRRRSGSGRPAAEAAQGRVAQWSARPAHNRLARGSSPRAPTIGGSGAPPGIGILLIQGLRPQRLRRRIHAASGQPAGWGRLPKPCRHGAAAAHLPSKQGTRVRSPLPAPAPLGPYWEGEHEKMKERIKKVRTTFGLTQSEFAERIQLSRSALCKIETGVNTASPRTIAKICDEFGTSREWLYEGKGSIEIHDLGTVAKVFKALNDSTERKNLFLELADNESEHVDRMMLRILRLLCKKGNREMLEVACIKSGTKIAEKCREELASEIAAEILKME